VIEMNFYENYKLVKDSKGYTLEIYLKRDDVEFSAEFLAKVKENTLLLEDKVKLLISEKFADIKINSVKLLIGGIVVGSFALLPSMTTYAATPQATATTTQVATERTATVTASSLNMRSSPSTTSSIMHVLWQGNTVKIIGETNGWYQIKLSDGRIGWANSQYLSLNNQATTRQAKVDAVIAQAKALIGTPYVYGGDSPSDGGFDCSGFTKYVFGKSGYTLNRISKDQALNGTYVARSNIQPGDLVFYSFSGNGVILQAGSWPHLRRKSKF
jgi:cell wall-associated NlpC family hydrolase